MQKVIDGKRYNTETATLIGNIGSKMMSDFTSWGIELFKAPRSGTYFLHEWGGPMTIYAERRGRDRIGGEKITPLDDEAAFEWAQNNLDGDEVMAEFGNRVAEA